MANPEVFSIWLCQVVILESGACIKANLSKRQRKKYATAAYSTTQGRNQLIFSRGNWLQLVVPDNYTCFWKFRWGNCPVAPFWLRAWQSILGSFLENGSLGPTRICRWSNLACSGLRHQALKSNRIKYLSRSTTNAFPRHLYFLLHERCDLQTRQGKNSTKNARSRNTAGAR